MRQSSSWAVRRVRNGYAAGRHALQSTGRIEPVLRIEDNAGIPLPTRTSLRDRDDGRDG